MLAWNRTLLILTPVIYRGQSALFRRSTNGERALRIGAAGLLAYNMPRPGDTAGGAVAKQLEKPNSGSRGPAAARALSRRSHTSPLQRLI